MSGRAGRVGVLAATRGEARVVARAVARHGGAVRLYRTGMGPAAAEAGARALLADGPLACVVLLGTAGGLDPALRVGDAVVATAHHGAPGAELGAPAATDETRTTSIAGALIAAGLATRSGVFVTSPRVVAAAAAKRALAADGAVAVEMEGLAVAQVCAAAGVPFASARVVLDPLDVDLPDRVGVGRPRAAVGLAGTRRRVAAIVRLVAAWRHARVALLRVAELSVAACARDARS